MSLFQSNLRKQIRNLPKILNFVKKIHYYSELFTSLLGRLRGTFAAPLGHRLGLRRGMGRGGAGRIQVLAVLLARYARAGRPRSRRDLHRRQMTPAAGHIQLQRICDSSSTTGIRKD